MVRLEYSPNDDRGWVRIGELTPLYHREWHTFHADILSPRKQVESVGKFDGISFSICSGIKV